MSPLVLPLLTSATAATFSGVALYWIGLRLYRSRSWLSIVGAFIPLTTVWILFVLGSLLYSVPVVRDWSYVYTLIDPSVLAFMSLVTMVGILAYAVTFKWLRRAVGHSLCRVSVSRRRQTLAGLMLLLLLVFDWYGRIESITSGTYFRWLAPTFREAFVASLTDPIFLLLGTTGYVILALALYLRTEVETRVRRFILNSLIVVHSLFLFARGSRREVFFILLIIGLVIAVEHTQQIKYWVRARSLAGRIILLSSGLAVLWVGIVTVPLARRSIRLAAAGNVNQPMAIIDRFLLQELPAHVFSTSMTGVEYNPAKDLVGRIISWPSFAGAIRQSQHRGSTEQIGLEGFVRSAQIAVPSVLMSGSKIRPNEVLYRHYSASLTMSRDPHGHPVTSGIAYLGLPGIIIVLVIGGLIAGVIVGALESFGKLGLYMAIGLLSAFIPFGTDVGAYLSSLRNALAVVITLYTMNLLHAAKLGR